MFIIKFYDNPYRWKRTNKTATKLGTNKTNTSGNRSFGIGDDRKIKKSIMLLRTGLAHHLIQTLNVKLTKEVKTANF